MIGISNKIQKKIMQEDNFQEQKYLKLYKKLITILVNIPQAITIKINSKICASVQIVLKT